MTILVVAIVALGLLVEVAAVISGFLWFSGSKPLERKHRSWMPAHLSWTPLEGCLHPPAVRCRAVAIPPLCSVCGTIASLGHRTE